MKKITAILLALLLVLSLSACGESNEDVKGTVEAPAEAEDSSAAEELPVQEPAEETEESSAEASSIEDADNGKFDIGSFNGGTYENSFFGFGCELDEQWHYMSREELAELSGLVEDIIDSDDYREQVEKLDLFYDMNAYADNDFVSGLNVNVTNLHTPAANFASKDSLYEETSGALIAQLEKSGGTDGQSEIVEIEFLGESCSALHSQVLFDGIPYYCTQLMVTRGNYIATITASSFIEDHTAEYISLFYPVG